MSIIEKKVGWIFANSLVTHLIVEVGAADEPGISTSRDQVAAFHLLTFTHESFREMGVQRLKAVTVVNGDHSAVPTSALARHDDDTSSGCHHRRTHIVHDVDTLMCLEDSEDRMHPHPKSIGGIGPFHRFNRRNASEVSSVVFIFLDYLFATLLLDA